jgi:hypothetical protein
MKSAPEFVKSPYWDIYTDKVKPGTPPDIKAELEKAYQEYLAEGQREAKAWRDASQAAIDKQKK